MLCLLVMSTACGMSEGFAPVPNVVGAKTVLLGERLSASDWRIHGFEAGADEGWPIRVQWGEATVPVLAFYDRSLAELSLQPGLLPLEATTGVALGDVFGAPRASYEGLASDTGFGFAPASALPAAFENTKVAQPKIRCPLLQTAPWLETVAGKYKWSFVGSDGAAWMGTNTGRELSRVTSTGVQQVSTGTVTVSAAFEDHEGLLIGDYAGYVFETVLDPTKLSTSYRKLGANVDRSGIYAVLRVDGTVYAVTFAYEVYTFEAGNWILLDIFSDLNTPIIPFAVESGGVVAGPDRQFRLRPQGNGFVLRFDPSGVEKEIIDSSSFISSLQYLPIEGWILGTAQGRLFQFQGQSWQERAFDWPGWWVISMAPSPEGFYAFLASGVVVHVDETNGDCPEPSAQVQVVSRGEMLPIENGYVVVSKVRNIDSSDIQFMFR